MKIQLVANDLSGELLLNGRLDSVTSPEVENIFRMATERFDRLVLNMEKLDYISSAGLRVLKITYMLMKKKNGELVIKNANSMVMEVFEMTGFVGILKFE